MLHEHTAVFKIDKQDVLFVRVKLQMSFFYALTWKNKK